MIIILNFYKSDILKVLVKLDKIIKVRDIINFKSNFLRYIGFFEEKIWYYL